MILTSKTIIGMEITPSQVKLIEMNISSRPTKVTNFAVIDLGSLNKEKIASRIKKILDKKGFTAKRVNIALSGPALDHKIITLPPMSKANIKTVVKREVKKDSKIPFSDLSFDYCVVGELEDRGIKKNEVLIVSTSTRQILETIDLTKEIGLEPQVLTTSSLSLLNGLGMSGKREKGEVASFVYLGTQSSIILVLEDGVLRFSRVFSLGFKGIEDEEDGIAFPEEEITFREQKTNISSRVITEVNRSFFYYKQHFRGSHPQRIILGGDIEEITKIKKSLENELSVEVEIFNPADSLDFSLLKEKEEEFLKTLSSFAVCLGSGWRGLKDININLLPLELQQRKQLIAKQVTAGIAAGALSILLVGGYISLAKSLASYQKILQDKEKIRESFQEETLKLLQAKRSQNLHESRIALLGDSNLRSSLWKGRLMVLSLLVPNEMILDSFESQKEGSELTVKITGRVIAENAVRSQSVFNRFYFQLKDSVLVKKIEPPDVKLKPFEKTQKGNQPMKKKMVREKGILSEISFTMNCQFWPDYY